MLIDVAIPGDRDIIVIKKEAEKILKYKDLIIEIQCMWNVTAKVIPVMIGATGTISKSLRHYLRKKPGNHEVRELQKTAILGTAHILRAASANIKVQNTFHGRNNITCSTNGKYRTAATICVPEILFVSGIRF
jgi:hypothetical protein